HAGAVLLAEYIHQAIRHGHRARLQESSAVPDLGPRLERLAHPPVIERRETIDGLIEQHHTAVVVGHLLAGVRDLGIDLTAILLETRHTPATPVGRGDVDTILAEDGRRNRGMAVAAHLGLPEHGPFLGNAYQAFSRQLDVVADVTDLGNDD